jgi:phosphoribosylformimino-5-aminoimidazole carboxamide ribotide isomerase
MIKIIPAIDIIDGKCVRLSQGDYNQKKIYNENPLEVAQNFEDAGIKHLHLVDLDGAKQKKIVNYKVLEVLANKTKLKIDFGGGIQSNEMVTMAFEYGANQITAGSIAVKNAEMVSSWIDKYGAEKIIIGADAKEEKIAISGWQEGTQLSIFDFVKNWTNLKAKYCISTDVSKDGMLQGPSFDLYQKLQLQNPKLHIIASGGISELSDIERLNDMNIYGVIVGKAIYEGRISLSDLKIFSA